MTVRGLREQLLGFPGDAVVILSSDAEGNDYKPLLEVFFNRAEVIERGGMAHVVLNMSQGGQAAILVPFD